MRGRLRYLFTFQVQEYWKGKLGHVVKLYVLSPGTDCMGGSYKLGEEYLIYALEKPAEDHKFDDFFWYGWTDVVPKGTLIIKPITACMPDGRTAEAAVKTALRELGKGQRPQR